MSYLLFGVISLFFSPGAAFAADIMFEGYYKVELGGKHIGYAIQRYEFEPKDKTFQLISFMRYSIGNKVTQESTKAKSDDKFRPISHQYTFTSGSETKTVDATYKGEVMTVKKTEGKKVINETLKMPKSTFFSSFLSYLILQKKLAVNEEPFKFSAIAEEDGSSFDGKALVDSKEKKDGFEEYRILGKFKGETFVMLFGVVKDPKDPAKNIRGDILASSSPAKGVVSTLVNPPALATEGQTVPNKTLITLFGSMPTGKFNLLAKEK